VKNVICIIPLRSKSKGIKDKNIKKILNIPLCIYVLSAAIKSKLFSKIIIACDNQKYFSVINNFLSKLYLNQKNISFFKRTKKNSTDFAKTELVLNEVIKKNKNYKYCYLLQATSPLLLKQDILKSYNTLISNKLDSLFSAYPTRKFLWYKKKNNFYSLNYDYKNRPMRQQKKIDFIETGAMYAFKISKFIKLQNRLFGKIGVFKMPIERSLDIDVSKDFKSATYFIKKNLKKYNFISLK